MSETSEIHRILIVNEEGEAPFVSPKVLGVARNDQVIFVVVGENDEFAIQPDTDLFTAVSPGEEIPVRRGSSPSCRISQEISPNTAHRYTVYSASYNEIDPIVGVYE